MSAERLLADFDALPPAARVEVMRHLSRAILWRGHDAGRAGIAGAAAPGHAARGVAAIVATLEAHGVACEEYT